MSTTTVSFRSTTRDADLAAVRRRQAEARRAAREARRREAQERLRAERERQLLAVLHDRIAEQEGRYQHLVEQLDEADQRLPDLSLKAPRLATLGIPAALDSGELAAYAAQLTEEVSEFEFRLGRAIARAEHLLKRRVAKASAWRHAADLEQRIEFLQQQTREAASRIRFQVQPPALPARPISEDELEAVEAYEARLESIANQEERRLDSLLAQVRSREDAIALSGDQLESRSAQDALAHHFDQRSAKATASLKAHRDAELARTGLSLEDLPEPVRGLIEAALEQAPETDYRASVTRWIARERQRRDGTARALQLLQNVPQLVREDACLSERWNDLASRLQRVAGGLEDFNPSIEREYDQLEADAKRLVNAAFTRADWIQAMCTQGFEVLEREDGQGLVVVDLDHPEVWLEATEYESEQGGFAASLELRTDAESLAEEGEITDDVCAKLARASGSAEKDVDTQAEIIEHDSRIKRARRPSVAQRAFYQSE